MVTICTASLTFSNSTFCPHNVFMCFVWISEQTAIISLYSINWLVFITETESVYCAVRTEPLNAIPAPFSLYRKQIQNFTRVSNKFAFHYLSRLAVHLTFSSPSPVRTHCNVTNCNNGSFFHTFCALNFHRIQDVASQTIHKSLLIKQCTEKHSYIKLTTIQ